MALGAASGAEYGAPPQAAARRDEALRLKKVEPPQLDSAEPSGKFVLSRRPSAPDEDACLVEDFDADGNTKHEPASLKHQPPQGQSALVKAFPSLLSPRDAPQAAPYPKRNLVQPPQLSRRHQKIPKANSRLQHP